MGPSPLSPTDFSGVSVVSLSSWLRIHGWPTGPASSLMTPLSSPHLILSLFLLLGDPFSKVLELGQVALSLFKGLKEIMKMKQAKERMTEKERD